MKYFILILLLLQPGVNYSQRKFTKQIVDNRISINAPDSTIVAFTLPVNSKVSPSNEKVYHWYKANKIRSSRGGYDGKLLHGEYKQFYGNLNLQSTGSFKRGLKTGTWKAWYLNGELQEISQWKNGSKNGRLVKYDEQNNRVEEHYYKNDEIKKTPVKFDKEGKKIKPERKNTVKNNFNSLFEKQKNSTPKTEKPKKQKDKKEKATKDKSIKTGQTTIIDTQPPAAR